MYLSPPLFPVHLDDVPARLIFHDAPDEPVTIGSATMRAGKVKHQGPTVGYRIEEHGQVLVYLPDHEPSLGTELSSIASEWLAVTTSHAGGRLVARCPDRDHEYAAHVGWGHSGLAHAMEFADRAGVRNLVLFHHDPYHDDHELEDLLTEAHDIWPAAEERRCLANEGMTIMFDQEGVRLVAR